MEVRQTHFAGRPEASRSEESPSAQGAGTPGGKEVGQAAQGRSQDDKTPPRLIEFPPPSEPALAAYVAADRSSRKLVEDLRILAHSRATVLIRGEVGSGKNLVARLLHDLGPHREEPLVHLDCAGLPSALLEAELFGTDRARSRLESTGNGTLVLNEVAALSMNMQSRLLRVIENRELDRGGQRIRVNARILVLSAVDLERALVRRAFREDLYYRLNVTRIMIRPLRERPADIEPLATHFLTQLAQMHRRPKPAFSEDALATLLAFDYPGNVRQLRNIMERLIVTVSRPEITAADLPVDIRPTASVSYATLEELERAHITQVLEATKGQKTKAAEILGISRKTLLEKRKRYGLG